jgi:pyrrolidone-carboxylate peptidase
MEKTHDRSARITKIIISHFPIVQAILPTNPSSIRMMAMIMKKIPRVRSQLVIPVGSYQGRILMLVPPCGIPGGLRGDHVLTAHPPAS